MWVWESPEFEPLIVQLEAALTPKQLKVVNFFVGKTMGELKKQGINGANPQLIRRAVIYKLTLATNEETDDGQDQAVVQGSVG